MAQLTIARTSQYTNRFSSIDLYMDNQKFGSIKNGETKTFDIAPGEHSFFAQADWVSSKPVTLTFDAATNKQLELGSPVKMNFARVIFSIVFTLWLIAKTFFKEQINVDAYLLPLIGAGLALSVLMYVVYKQKPTIYYYTIGIKENIYLREPEVKG